jgi:hypothetical protein
MTRVSSRQVPRAAVIGLSLLVSFEIGLPEKRGIRGKIRLKPGLRGLLPMVRKATQFRRGKELKFRLDGGQMI